MAALAFGPVVLSCSPSWSSHAVRTAPPPPASCAVLFGIEWSAPDDATRVVTVTATNQTDAAIDFELPDRCPHPLIALEGLPDGFDERLTCAMGACLGSRSAVHVHLAPNQRREISTTELPLDGTSCVAPLPREVLLVGPVVPQLSVPTCGRPASVDLRRGPDRAPPIVTPEAPAPPAPTTAPPQAPEPPQPPVAPAPPGDPYACSTAADCVLSCPNASGCCGWPCGCQHAIRRDHAAEFEANYARSCSPRAPNCPDVACMRQDAMFATCRDGRCVGASSLSGW